MAFERAPPDMSQASTAADLILKRGAIVKDQNGRVIRGEFPNEYLTETPGYFNKDATLANKNKEDLHYDYQHILIQNRLIRENIPDEEYTLANLIQEMDREYAAINLDTMNKEGANNNRRLINTNITESTTKNIDGTLAKQGGGGMLNWLFRRR